MEWQIGPKDMAASETSIKFIIWDGNDLKIGQSSRELQFPSKSGLHEWWEHFCG
jgi:hypothetical protein